MTKEIDIILNASPEELITTFKGMNQGELTSFRNRFIILYEQNKHLKDALIKKVNKEEVTPEEADPTIQQLYLTMQRIENVVVIANEVINSRKF